MKLPLEKAATSYHHVHIHRRLEMIYFRRTHQHLLQRLTCRVVGNDAASKLLIKHEKLRSYLFYGVAFLRAGDLWLAEEAVHFSLTKVFFFQSGWVWIHVNILHTVCVHEVGEASHGKMSSCNYSKAPSASGKFQKTCVSASENWGKKKYIYFINVPLKIDSCSLRSLITFIHSACRERERGGRVSFPPWRDISGLMQ